MSSQPTYEPADLQRYPLPGKKSHSRRSHTYHGQIDYDPATAEKLPKTCHVMCYTCYHSFYGKVQKGYRLSAFGIMTGSITRVGLLFKIRCGSGLCKECYLHRLDRRHDPNRLQNYYQKRKTKQHLKSAVQRLLLLAASKKLQAAQLNDKKVWLISEFHFRPSKIEYLKSLSRDILAGRHHIQILSIFAIFPLLSSYFI